MHTYLGESNMASVHCSFWTTLSILQIATLHVQQSVPSLLDGCSDYPTSERWHHRVSAITYTILDYNCGFTSASTVNRELTKAKCFGAHSHLCSFFSLTPEVAMNQLIEFSNDCHKSHRKLPHNTSHFLLSLAHSQGNRGSSSWEDKNKCLFYTRKIDKGISTWIKRSGKEQNPYLKKEQEVL